ncbi:hypothetical protein O181_048934 [Austropuccinia psidii MF-1]|uniref:GAG-pre-integrase domain-containing protein n=1 Tax=Austropuccinia psidii MF-1 TaxID=1389203 RepID=A0A9Q3DTX9_9BASI|nr:hypothetical protein [Austropuccinia psidii MF-1]
MDQTNKLQVMSLSEPNTEQIHDSGASRLTVCNLALLYKTQPTCITMRTFSGTIVITLMGKLSLGGFTLYPVYYAPQGQSNLISESQLEDHGLRLYQKNNMIIVKSGNKIVQSFPREGNLYVSQYNFSSNLIQEDFSSHSTVDWHIMLGHPSTQYLNKFLQHNKINQQPSFSTIKHCHSNVPINFWDEAVKYSSLLINILPSHSINWKSPVSTLLDHRSTIEPTRNLNQLIPFGLKVFVSRSMGSKVLPPFKPLLYLGPEDYSDTGRLLDPQSHRLVVSRDYTPTTMKFYYHSPDTNQLPKPTSQQQSFSPILSPPTQELPSVPTETTEPEEPPTHQQASIAPTSPSCIPNPQKKGYSYVPHYTTAPKNIIITVSQDNILASP